MAEGDDSEKTEEPTHRKLEKAHEQGDVPKSQEVVTFFTMGAVTLIVAFGASSVTHSLSGPLTAMLEHSGDLRLDGGGLLHLWYNVGDYIFTALLIPFLFVMIAGVGGHMIQHRPVLSGEGLKPKFSKVSPLAGLKRLFSAEALVNFAKGLLKMSLVGAVLFLIMWPQRRYMAPMVSMDLAELLAFTQDLSMQMLKAVLAILALIAIGDLMWQRHRWTQKQRMSVQEVKEEHKQAEGDPTIKAKIRQIRLERSRKRMMAAVPSASVVITNPTHYAVALKYETGMPAPVCVAKGVDQVALRIRELATSKEVPIVENPPLARALYASVDLDQMIPEEHYKAVAEVIGFVMRLKNRNADT
ncbi:Flagellar biosynthetic protein FlhB [Hartmannibacter diazotrophicus]|uniref:Flagellar biosynthetic protein FlhB n=1 Tax=Hartmannibacter diazotrophicus TaxID=1482074 RepID=A0A2C9D8Z6_9HYPH|nr:flagellar biosynthesis protein FlhB [Hartmannibacter diazotrophicus]SON56201.1 Flagellar biosynthetic protein FlhB [Hartmannibacter diazotrophicus]